MEKVSQKDIDWLLNLNKHGVGKELRGRTYSAKQISLLILFALLLIFGLTVLPFYLLVRTSVYLNVDAGFNGWLALFGGICATIILLFGYILLLFRKIQNRGLVHGLGMAGASALVLGFCCYGVFYLSSVHAKNDAVRDVYRSLHPVLRTAVAVTTLADGDLVITDIRRVPEDYSKMGLPLNQASLHFEQTSGYVHAIDLRTRDRWQIRNFMLRNSLRLMGFQTLRHIGTSDHLHVSLPAKE